MKMRKAILDENKRVVRLEQITETHRRTQEEYAKILERAKEGKLTLKVGV